jgi:hypothetical protein
MEIGTLKVYFSRNTTLCVETKVNLIENVAKFILNEYLVSKYRKIQMNNLSGV